MQGRGAIASLPLKILEKHVSPLFLCPVQNSNYIFKLSSGKDFIVMLHMCERAKVFPVHGRNSGTCRESELIVSVRDLVLITCTDTRCFSLPLAVQLKSEKSQTSCCLFSSPGEAVVRVAPPMQIRCVANNVDSPGLVITQCLGSRNTWGFFFHLLGKHLNPTGLREHRKHVVVNTVFYPCC